MPHQQSSVPDLAAVGLRQPPPEIVQGLRESLRATLGLSTRSFPGAQPVSFARHHIQALKQRDYYLCEKSDGVRCLLYMTADDNDREVQYFIDRKNQYYYVPQELENGMPGFHAPRAPPPGPDMKPGPIEWESFHVKTVLDGELLWDTYPSGERILKYLVFDCLTLDGEDMTTRTLDKRLAYFMEKVYMPYEQLLKTFPDDCQFIFKIEKKDFQFSYATQMVFNDVIPRLKHGSDGVMFTCRETPYKYGTDENILKWKPAEENSIDFRVSMEFPVITQNGHDEAESDWDRDYEAMPKFHLFVHQGQHEYAAFDDMHVEVSEWEDMKSYAIERDDGLEGAVVECYKDGQGRWRFLRWREDKNEGNHRSTVQKIQESIEDAVSKQELIGETQEIRAKWKQRAAEQQARDREENLRRRGQATQGRARA